MTEFKTWLEHDQSVVVTFDFDSTLTTPVYDADNELWEPDEDQPNTPNVARLRQEHARGAKIYIVTSRSEGERGGVELFVSKNNLPIEGIICTGGDKGAALVQLGSIRHYDDMEQSSDDARGLFEGEWIKVHHPFENHGVKL